MSNYRLIKFINIFNKKINEKLMKKKIYITFFFFFIFSVFIIFLFIFILKLFFFFFKYAYFEELNTYLCKKNSECIL